VKTLDSGLQWIVLSGLPCAMRHDCRTDLASLNKTLGHKHPQRSLATAINLVYCSTPCCGPQIAGTLQADLLILREWWDGRKLRKTRKIRGKGPGAKARNSDGLYSMA
jgi:hypothetical protein